MARPPSLVDQRQAWGLLPTWSFWNEQDLTYIQLPLWLASASMTALASIVGAPTALVYMAPGLTFALGLGILERYIRRRVLRRRTELEDVPQHRASPE